MRLELRSSAAGNTRLPRALAGMDLVTGIGLAAAFCTTLANYPQLKKCWETGSTGDLSWKMLATLAAGLTLWLLYGIFRKDVVIILANVASLAMVLGILFFKLRELRRER